jgi:hypothetical protein
LALLLILPPASLHVLCRTGQNISDYSGFAKDLDMAWGFVVNENIAPVWLGEFGTTHDAAGISSIWWKQITR